MKKMGIICVTILAAAMAAQGAGGASIPEDFSGWVDPFVGTSATGHTSPAACVPFGMVQAGPDTIGADGLWWHYCGGYRYEDGRIVGFSQTHLNGTDGRTFQLWLDGELQAETPLPPLRAYGNLTPMIGESVNGKDPKTGLLHDLELNGSTK